MESNYSRCNLATVKTWDIDRVFQWALQTLGPVTAEKLKSNEVDGEALVMLEYQDCYCMQIPAGPRRKLMAAIAEYKGVAPGVVSPGVSKYPSHFSTPLNELMDMAWAQGY